MLFVISQTRCSNLSLADCCTQSVDCCPLLVYWNSFLATSSLDSAKCLMFSLRCSLITYLGTLLATHAFSHNARNYFKEVNCIKPAYRFSMLNSCFALLTAVAQFFCLVACCSRLFPFLLFVVHYSLLYTRCWPRTDYICFVPH